MEGPVIPHLRQVVLDSTDARASAEFWRQLLGLVYREGHEPPPLGDDDPAGRDWLNLLTPSGDARLAFQQVKVQSPNDVARTDRAPAVAPRPHRRDP